MSTCYVLCTRAPWGQHPLRGEGGYLRSLLVSLLMSVFILDTSTRDALHLLAWVLRKRAWWPEEDERDGEERTIRGLSADLRVEAAAAAAAKESPEPAEQTDEEAESNSSA